MANTFEAIDKCIADYYSAVGDDTYYDGNSKLGKFLFYCTENGLEETDLQEELEDNGAEDCMYLEFAQDEFGRNRFPFSKEIENEQQEMEEMFKILQYIYHSGKAPKVVREVIDFELEVTANDTQRTVKLYQSQVFSMLGAVGLNDGTLMEFLTIGVRNNDLQFLNSVVDSYSRDSIAAANDDKRGCKELHVHDWVQTNKFLKELHLKNESKVSKFTSAVNSYVHRIVPKLQMEQIYKVKDDMRHISLYIVIVSQLINNILHDASPPFMVDIMIAVKDTTEVKDGSDLPNLGDDTDSEDEDVEEKEKEKAYYGDKIGDIEHTLNHEKLVYVKTNIDSNQVSNIALMTRRMISIYREFKTKLKPQQNIESYPHKKRFNVVIDRRNDEESMVFFDPPSNCSKMPRERHVPEWYFCAARQCLIPCVGYKLEAAKGKQNKAINALSKINGRLITLSFHIEAVDEIKCYLIYEGQTTRFYPQDIVQVFPKLFDMEYKNNAQFIKSEEAQQIAKQILIKDVHFETFYRSFGNDIYGANHFPKHVYNLN